MGDRGKADRGRENGQTKVVRSESAVVNTCLESGTRTITTRAIYLDAFVLLSFLSFNVLSDLLFYIITK